MCGSCATPSRCGCGGCSAAEHGAVQRICSRQLWYRLAHGGGLVGSISRPLAQKPHFYRHCCHRGLPSAGLHAVWRPAAIRRLAAVRGLVSCSETVAAAWSMAAVPAAVAAAGQKPTDPPAWNPSLPTVPLPLLRFYTVPAGTSSAASSCISPTPAATTAGGRPPPSAPTTKQPPTCCRWGGAGSGGAGRGRAAGAFWGRGKQGRCCL